MLVEYKTRKLSLPGVYIYETLERITQKQATVQE
jgi:hypothetical protein